MPYYHPTSRVYGKVLELTARSFYYGKGLPPNSTPNFKTAWMSFVKGQGVRIYRVSDWNLFWRRVSMLVIKYQTDNLGNSELNPDHDIFDANIRRLIKDMPEDNPVLSRGQYFGSHTSFPQLVALRNTLQALLVYTARASEDAGKDYPAWFNETESLSNAVFNGMYLRKQKVKKYFFTSEGTGRVGSVDVRPAALEDRGVVIQDHFYSPEEARKLAYTIIESVNYVEEQSHINKK